jgi:hypothetical protein
MQGQHIRHGQMRQRGCPAGEMRQCRNDDSGAGTALNAEVERVQCL